MTAAEAALQRGDYQQCLALLEPLAKKYPLTIRKGAQIRMLMITAWMGKGDNDQAISTCRLITNCKDPELRQEARQLLSVLEAPNLPRPENWSISLPSIEVSEVNGRSLSKNTRRKKSKPDKATFPPTGPTKALEIGFSIFVLIVLSGLTLLLKH